MMRALKNALKRVAHRTFLVGQRCGVDVLSRHFYSSIPDIRELRETSYWRFPCTMFGVNGADVAGQIAFVEECCAPPLRARLKEGGIYERACKEAGEPGYGPIEADFLFCVMATKRPRRIVQIGAGVSTAVILLAAREAGYSVDLVCIDPYPSRFLKDMHARGHVALIAEKAQVVQLEELTKLGDQGMLFMDSTHTVKAGSEVNRVVLEVLPRLPCSSLVHFHDIYFPYDYPRSLFQQTLFPSESTLLHAFLLHNPNYAIRASLSMLHYQCPGGLQRFLPNYRPQPNFYGLRPRRRLPGHFPSSTYLQVTPSRVACI